MGTGPPEWQLEQIPELEAQYVRDKALYDADYQNWKRKGRDKGEPPPEKPQEPRVDRYVVNDTTIEALAEILSENPRGVLAACDELATWLGAFDQYRSGRGSDAAKWLSIHRAEGLIVDRKTGKRTIFVKRAAVSVAGSIQPRVLYRALADQYFDNGLAARLLLASPPRVAKRWTEATVDADTYRAVERVYGRLLALNFGTDENDQPAPIDVRLSSEALAVWAPFFDVHANLTASVSGKLAAAYSKLEAYAARLALVVYMVKAVSSDDWTITENSTIDADSMTAGITLARWFAHEVERVYRIIEESDTETEQRQILDFIRGHGGKITANDLRRRSRKFETTEEAEEFLRGLVDAGLGYWTDGAPSQDGGRPTRYFRVSETPTKYGENEV